MDALYESVLRPRFFRDEPETAHERVMEKLEALTERPWLLGLMARFNQVRYPRPIRFAGLDFPNAIGLAAGFDKDARVWPAMLALGFGHVEVGTVTQVSQKGNPRPRIFRYPEQHALINRMGFPNAGADAIAAHLATLRKRFPRLKSPLGVNIGKSATIPLESATADYLETFRKVSVHADYIAVNVSSPNTPGLRQLQAKPQLTELLTELQKANHEKKPLFVKIAPDLTFPQLDDVLEVIEASKLSGIIATNTLLARPAPFSESDEKGGLSGTPLNKRAAEVIRYLSLSTGGKLPIIGAGGADDEVSAGRLFDAGASLVQVYTGLVYRGPWLGKTLAQARRWKQENWVV